MIRAILEQNIGIDWVLSTTGYVLRTDDPEGGRDQQNKRVPIVHRCSVER